MKRFLIPLGLFFVLVVFLAVGLTRDPHEVPSPLIDKPAPQFKLPQVLRSDLSFSPQDMRGKVWLLNVWSSWCVSCRYEHPLLVEKSQQGLLPPVIGLSYKELRGDGETDTRRLTPGDEMQLARQRAAAWLGQHGNPYSLTVLDIDGRVGIDYGVYGVPETYVIDKAGIIRYKQIGPITAEALDGKIIPLVQKLEKES